MVYVLIPFFERFQNLPILFRNLGSQDYGKLRVVLIDHGRTPINGTDTLPSYVIYVREGSDKWWSGAINAGLREVLDNQKAEDEDFVLLQNDDVDFSPTLISELVRASGAERAIVGAITLKKGSEMILDANNRLSFWRARHVCPLRGKRLDSVREHFLEADVLKGRGVLYPVSIVRRMGYTEERLHYRADPEWSYRAKKMGCRLGIVPSVKVETILDTQENARRQRGLAFFLDYLFSKKSTQNVLAAYIYFRLCFGPVKGLYCASLHTVRALYVGGRIAILGR